MGPELHDTNEARDQVPALHPEQVDAPDTEYELGPQS